MCLLIENSEKVFVIYIEKVFVRYILRKSFNILTDFKKGGSQLVLKIFVF